MRPAVKVAVTVDAETLRRVDASARRRRVSRSRYVSDALRAALKAEAEDDVRSRVERVLADPESRRGLLESAESLFAAAGVREEEDAW
ncbi:MAG: hypothetical protein FJ087_02325 [Deltaproteobacteria bacterium]|jgi:metal-responsive CopG/Arc/MetJ family transcriptional regulator|nr:hypothetical protein [Deltaproteobacteria bacterium]